MPKKHEDAFYKDTENCYLKLTCGIAAAMRYKACSQHVHSAGGMYTSLYYSKSTDTICFSDLNCEQGKSHATHIHLK